MATEDPPKEEKIVVENVVIADPEIAFKLKLDKTKITQKIARIILELTLTENNRTFKSLMSMGRTFKYGSGPYEEIIDDEFDLIFPFVDPHYQAGQEFKYELKVTLRDLQDQLIMIDTIKGTHNVAGNDKYLDYKIENGRMNYTHLNKNFPVPGNGKLDVFEPLAGKPGLGVRISWGTLERDVYTIRLIGSFENGKAPVNVWLNMDKQYKPKYLPLTVFVPYPKGVDSPEKFQYSFSVELFDINHKHINFQAETNIPWSVDQPFSSVS